MTFEEWFSDMQSRYQAYYSDYEDLLREAWAAATESAAGVLDVMAALFAVIGTTYGAGDGSTTFAVPDLRGEFIRGWDDGRGVDAGRVIGSPQADDFKSHAHTTTTANSGTFSYGSGAIYCSAVGAAAKPVSDASGGAETRPRNVAMLACIFTGV